jgi:hypothetical protein
MHYCTAQEGGSARKPLSPTAKETIGAVNNIVHGALGMVQHKDEKDEKEFATSIHELAAGIANLILVNVNRCESISSVQRKEIEAHITEFVNNLQKIILQNDPLMTPES